MSSITDPELTGNPSSPPIKNANERPECFKSTLHECLFVASTTLSVAATSFLLGSVTVISSFAGRDLGMTSAEITWMNAASALSSGALLLFFGSLADLFGRKSMFIGSLFLFAVFNLAAGFSNTGITLDILNGVLGIWSASMVPPAQGMLGVIYPQASQRKNKVFACFSAGNPLGFVAGSIFSGLAAQIFSWRASFWLLAIVYLVVTIMAFFTVPNDAESKVQWNKETVRRMDLVGTGLTIVGIGLFCAALSLGADAPQGWKTPYVLVFLILGILFMAAFVCWEIKYEYAMIPMSIWKDRDFSLLLAILSLGMLGFPVFSFWVALYFQQVDGMNPLLTGVHLLPMIIMGLLINAVAAFVLHKISNKQLMGVGAVAYLIAFVLAAVNKDGITYWALLFPALCLCVIGTDFEFNVANMYVVSSLPLSRQSIAGSLVQTISRLCTAVGYGIATAIFQAVQKSPSTSGYYANNAAEPYAGVFWFSAAVCGVSVLLVPFLRIGTQGHEQKDEGMAHEIERTIAEETMIGPGSPVGNMRGEKGTAMEEETGLDLNRTKT
ncbi:MFS general substrate transporter [Delitschia confertaspora ATCC 74209]|uniref:MFS general substrate transporter n=1 Tax=Delitschia confertaspora ATCC 74209 TaxID=1513339 RepID=A0A9P4N0N5_9PLEO|nr:MFS general substrate transporter [Delitschia confertaspora ATCC 74209]